MGEKSGTMECWKYGIMGQNSFLRFSESFLMFSQYSNIPLFQFLCLDGVFPALTRSDADDLIHRKDEDFSISDLSGFGGPFDCFDHLGD